MSPRIGFVILSNRGGSQLARLVGRLVELYEDPPIALHHDFGQGSLDTDQLTDVSKHLSIVAPHITTGWGKFSVVTAALKALELLYPKPPADEIGPDHFVLLSASDYPVRPAEYVLDDLRHSNADAFIDYRRAGLQRSAALAEHGPGSPAMSHFESAENSRVLYRRYLAAQLYAPRLRTLPDGSRRLGRSTLALPFDSPWHPFSAERPCFYGDHWFTANRAVATRLLQPSKFDLAVQRHLRLRASADECYYQSTILNEPSLVVERDNRRFAKWNGGGAHPQWLTCEDLPDIARSGAHFARKIAPDSPLLDELDRTLGIG